MVDTFKGPPQRQGVIGRLALDRALSDYGFEINLSVSGLSSETITIYGEGVSGALVSYPPIYQAPSGRRLVGSTIQNGSFTIKVDDLQQEWESIVFLKSGASDTVSLTIESLFDYVEAPAQMTASAVRTNTQPISDGWGLGPWGEMVWGG